jgi:hypothetical protein
LEADADRPPGGAESFCHVRPEPKALLEEFGAVGLICLLLLRAFDPLIDQAAGNNDQPDAIADCADELADRFSSQFGNRLL